MSVGSAPVAPPEVAALLALAEPEVVEVESLDAASRLSFCWYISFRMRSWCWVGVVRPGNVGWGPALAAGTPEDRSDDLFPL